MLFSSKILRWLPGVVGLLFFALYSLTAAPSIIALFDDTLEFQLVGPTFAIAHPTGYPLYLLLGGLWSRVLLPVGNWAWRMNLLSALTAAGAVALLTTLASRLVTTTTGQPNYWAGLAAALAFGLGPLWWSQATIAEVYTLHGLLVIAILAVATDIHDGAGRQQSNSREMTSSPSHPITLSPSHLVTLSRRLTLLCLLIGLGLAHHRTTLLIVPGLLIYLLWSVPGLGRPQRNWWQWLAALLAPLLLYLWLPVRAATGVIDLHGSYVNSWAGFFNHILARGYTGFFADNALAQSRSADDWWQIWLAQTGSCALILGLLGLLWLVDRQWRPAKAWVLVLLVLLANLLFAIVYKVPDAEVFLLPALLAFALFVGAGYGLVARLLQRWPWLASLAQAVLLILIGLGVSGRGPWVNRSQEWAVHDYAVALAKVDFPPASQVVALEGEATALKYMQQAEGLAVNASAVVADDPEQRRRVIAQMVAQGRPTYLTRELEGIAQHYSFSGEGPLVRVWPRGQAQVGAPQQVVNESFANGALRLVGYDLARLNQAGDPALRIGLYWQPQAPLTQTLKLSLRLQDQNGAPILSRDGQPIQADRFPLRLVASTSDWVVGETIRDVQELTVPLPTNSQPARLQVILYDAETVVEVGAWVVTVPWQ